MTMRRALHALTSAAAILPILCAADDGYDLLIRNGHVIDGSGSPWYSGDVAIRDGRIAAMGDLKNSRAKRTIDVPVEIFHLKAAGKANWGNAAQVIERIEAARARGVDVAADTSAYTAWANGLSAFIPPWAHDGPC